MGTWGEHSFDNDAAADLLADIDDMGVDAIVVALEGVVNAFDEGEVDYDTSAAAIAAAEIVAIALGQGREGEQPDDVARAFRLKQDIEGMAGIADLARQAVTAAGAPQTEIYTLWTEDGADGDWVGAVSELMGRLEAAHLAHGGVWEFSAETPRVAMDMTKSEATAMRLDLLEIVTRIDMLGQKIERKLEALEAKIERLERKLS